MLTVLNELARWQNKDPDEFDLDGFKIVYIAPMKALVQEMVGHLQTRLVSKPASSLVILKRLSNKSPRRRLSSPQQKNGKSSLARVPVPAILTVRLVIIDEIHLLHDDCGPVLKAIIARTIRRMSRPMNLSVSSVSLLSFPTSRMLPLSSAWMKERPILFRRNLPALWSPAAVHRYHREVMNQVCYEKDLDQPLVFVHSHKEAAKTANSSGI